MTWAQRLKRVFNIDIETCGRCGRSLKVIACIEDQCIIDRILTHLREQEQQAPARPLLAPPTRAPPETLPFFSLARNPRTHGSISREATEQKMAWVPAYSRTGMSRYELHDHRRKTEFRPLGGHFANFSSSVIRISEEILSQQAVCMSYT